MILEPEFSFTAFTNVIFKAAFWKVLFGRALSSLLWKCRVFIMGSD